MIIFQQVGAFYECIGPDAAMVADILDIRCTQLCDGRKICGFPVWGSSRLLARLDYAGIVYRVENEGDL